MFAYLRLPETNLRVELIDASTKEAFYERWGLDDPDALATPANESGAPFQAGLVVSSIEKAMAELAQALGTRWGTVTPIAVGKSIVSFVFGDPSPHLELIQRKDGTDAPSGLDHLCFWSDDLGADVKRPSGPALG